MQFIQLFITHYNSDVPHLCARSPVPNIVVRTPSTLLFFAGIQWPCFPYVLSHVNLHSFHVNGRCESGFLLYRVLKRTDAF